MSFTRYPDYKDSTAVFLGNIPVHWQLKRLKNCADLFPSNVDKKSVEGQISVRLCNYTDVYYNDIIDADLNFMAATATKEQIKRFELEQGDVVFTKDSESANDIGIAALVPKKVPGVIYGYHLSIARALDHVSGNFLKRYFDSNETKAYFEISANGLTRVGLGQYAVDNAPIALPSLEEQTQIARFLDHETAKIDALIREQERLIALLQEKRQAVISHTVTKGLDPNVPMKDSGVEWLGEVPAHWTVSRIKFHASVKGRIGFRGYTADDLVEHGKGALLIGATEMTGEGDIILKSPQNMTWEKYHESPEIMLEEGMVLFVQRGSTVGKVAFVPEGLGPATINPSLIVLRDIDIAPRFITYSLMSSTIQTLVKVETSSTAIPMISQEQVGNYWQVIPPSAEQKEIVRTILEKTEMLQGAISASTNGIKLLRERRSSVISAAVTGKIDVRNWQPPADESAFDESVRQAGMEATA